MDLHAVQWRLGNPESLPTNRIGLRLALGPRTEEEAFDLLLRGELDAVMVTGGPRYWSLFGGDQIDEQVRRHPGTRPLVADSQQIAEVYRRTRLYPITDLAVVTPDLVRGHPELPARLVQAFSQANALAPRYRPADEQRLAEREVELLGEDPHQYGLSPNARANLAAFLDFLYRLGATERPLAPEELLVPSAL